MSDHPRYGPDDELPKEFEPVPLPDDMIKYYENLRTPEFVEKSNETLHTYFKRGIDIENLLFPLSLVDGGLLLETFSGAKSIFSGAKPIFEWWNKTKTPNKLMDERLMLTFCLYDMYVTYYKTIAEYNYSNWIFHVIAYMNQNNLVDKIFDGKNKKYDEVIYKTDDEAYSKNLPLVVFDFVRSYSEYHSNVAQFISISPKHEIEFFELFVSEVLYNEYSQRKNYNEMSDNIANVGIIRHIRNKHVQHKLRQANRMYREESHISSILIIHHALHTYISNILEFSECENIKDGKQVRQFLDQYESEYYNYTTVETSREKIKYVINSIDDKKEETETKTEDEINIDSLYNKINAIFHHLMEIENGLKGTNYRREVITGRKISFTGDTGDSDDIEKISETKFKTEERGTISNYELAFGDNEPR